MAVDHRGRKIGCAFYSMEEQRLSLMEDIEFPTSDCLDACECSRSEVWLGLLM
jgi:DNA mismatch repair protein MSH5